MRKEIHISRHIALICFGVLIGLVLSRQYTDVSGAYVGVAIILGFASIKRPSVRLLPLALVSGLLLGMWRGATVFQESSIVDSLLGEQVKLSGQLSEDVSIGKNSKYVVKLQNIELNDTELPGKFLLTTDSSLNLSRSDTITAQGQLSSPVGGYVGAIYQGDIVRLEKSSTYDVGLRAREWFSKQLDDVMNPENIGFALGILVGSKSDIDEQFTNNLRTVGLTHIIVASGFNLTVLIAFARRLFAKISRYSACLIGSSLIVGFISVSGLSPSMMRAGTVAGLSLLAWYFGKKINPLVLLLIVGSITAWSSPFYVWGDGGWYLSFLAFYGVLIVAPLADGILFADKKPHILRSSFVETMSALLMTSPYILYTFGEFSFVSPLANMAVVPMIPLTMLMVFMAGIFSYVFQPVGVLFGFISDWLVRYIEATARYFSGIEPNIDIQFTKVSMIVTYGLIFIVTLVSLKINEKYTQKLQS